jgi:hypothetical protein
MQKGEKTIIYAMQPRPSPIYYITYPDAQYISHMQVLHKTLIIITYFPNAQDMLCNAHVT